MGVALLKCNPLYFLSEVFPIKYFPRNLSSFIYKVVVALFLIPSLIIFISFFESKIQTIPIFQLINEKAFSFIETVFPFFSLNSASRYLNHLMNNIATGYIFFLPSLFFSFFMWSLYNVRKKSEKPVRILKKVICVAVIIYTITLILSPFITNFLHYVEDFLAPLENLLKSIGFFEYPYITFTFYKFMRIIFYSVIYFISFYLLLKRDYKPRTFVL